MEVGRGGWYFVFEVVVVVVGGGRFVRRGVVGKLGLFLQVAVRGSMCECGVC